MNFFFKFSIFIVFILIASASTVANDRNNQYEFPNIENETSIKNCEPADIPEKIIGETSFSRNTPDDHVTLEISGRKTISNFTNQIDANLQPIIKSSGNSDTALVSINTSVKDLADEIISLKDSKGIQFTQYKSTSISLEAPPIVDFSFTNDNSCSGTSIQFTSDVTGTGPFTYTWNFGDGQTSTAKNPTHRYTSLGCGTETFPVSLTVSDDTLSVVKNKQIIVIQQPDISFIDVNSPFDPFSNCSNASITNPSYSITVGNNSQSACITSYSIDWGDGNTPVSNVTFPIEHTYTTLGAFDMIITGVGTNCSRSIKYIVKNQTNPSGGLISPGETINLCAPTDSLKFEIAKWGTNSPGTIYEVDYGDNSTVLIFTQEELIASEYYSTTNPSLSANFPIPHLYNTSNCPNSKFTVILTVRDACATTTFTADNITVLTKPETDFTVPPACINSSVLFTNTTISGSGINCSQNTYFTWDFGDGSAIENYDNTLPENKAHTYSTPGTYNVTLTAGNFCGESSKTNQITINPLPTATISGDANVCLGDTPPSITFVGANGSAPYTFTYKINNGANQTVTTSGGDSVKMQVPTGTAGTFIHTLISVQEGSASACAQPQTGNATIVVNPSLTATINGSDSICINETSPRITFTGANGVAPYTFTYNINGNANQTITTTTGDTVSIQVPTNTGGIFKYNLIDVQDADVNANACTLSQTGSATITINDQLPEPMSLDNYEFCNGTTTPVISFSNNIPGTTYAWTNSNTSIGLGSSGSGNIEVFIARNNTSDPITSTITVIAFANGCNGASQTFTITVNPAASVIFSQENQIICSGESATEILLSSATAGVDLSWTTEQPIGIAEAITLAGTNTILAQTLTNTSNAPITLMYEAKATLSGVTTCDGVQNIYTITVNPKPIVSGSLRDTICSGTYFSISPVNDGGNIIPAETKYTWSEPFISPAGAIIGASKQSISQSLISQTLGNTTSAIATVTYSVTPVSNECAGDPFEIVVYVIPGATAVPLNNLTLCNKELNPEIILGNNSAGSVYKWSTNNANIGMMDSSGSDKIPAFTATNYGNSPITATITVFSANEFGNSICDGTQVQFSITVNPTAQVNKPGNLNLCNGQGVSINLATENTVGTTTYEWTNSNTDVGLEASGHGDISFNTSNTTDTALTAEITVIPAFSNNGYSCEGPSEQFLITVNPSPTVEQPGNQTICNGNFVSEIKFSGNTAGATYDWSINNESIGLPASGTGDIPAFIAVNNDLDSVVAVITLTPSFNGCEGPPKNFKITVHPSAIILKQPSSSTVCLGEKPVPLSVIHTNGIKAPGYQWYSNTSNSTIGGTMIQNETNASFIPPSSDTNTMYYYCIITFPTGGCSTLTSDIAKVQVNPNPIVVLNDEKISRNQELKFCRGGSIHIHASGANTYLWNAGLMGDSIIINDIGDYRVIGISQNGCRDTFYFSASYFDLQNYTIQSDKEEVTNEENQIELWTDNIPNSYYSWDFGDGSTGQGLQVTHSYNVVSDGYFDVNLKVIDPNGCQEEFTKKIWISAASFPNTFTPNGDNVNDFYLEGWYKEIYNRNGFLIYKGEAGWDGNYKGKPVDNDTYFVVIFDSSVAGAKYKTTYVTVLR